MNRTVHLTFAAVAFLLVGATPYSVQLDVARCLPLSSQAIAELGPDWSAMVPHVQRCSVPGPDGRVALNVDIVRLDQAYSAEFFVSHQNQMVPLPVLRDAAGSVVGTLPEGFPIDPPGVLKVRFTDWHQTFPHYIRLYQAGESAVPPHALPSLRWNPKAKLYL